MTLQVMGVHGFQKALGDSFATLLLATAHSGASRPLGCSYHTSAEPSSDVILPPAGSLGQEEVS
jgi:hypothetical protein